MSKQQRLLRKLRASLDKALRKERFTEALDLYAELERAEPDEPRWPHRHGDLLRRLGKERHAIDAYTRAVARYAGRGFVARAAAMAKVILQIDESRIDVLESVDPEAARRMLQEKRKRYSEDQPAAAPRMSMVDSAPMLVLDEDADEDEVRFLEIDEDEAIEIEVSDAELAPREPKPRSTLELDADDLVFLDLDDEPERAHASILAELPSTPLFADVPQEVLQRLLMDAELSEASEGTPLLREGEPSVALYVLVEGQAEVRVPGLPEAIPVGEGDVLGETCLLDDVERRADVVAGPGGVQALRIPKTTLDELVPQHPLLGDVLLELLGRRLISNLLQTSPIFAGFDPGTRREVAALFQLRRAEQGMVLIAAGKRSDGLYCTLLGDLVIGGELHGPGAVVGQQSLLGQGASEVDVVCESDVLLLRLPAKRFNELAAMYPPVLMYLSELAARG